MTRWTGTCNSSPPLSYQSGWTTRSAARILRGVTARPGPRRGRHSDHRAAPGYAREECIGEGRLVTDSHYNLKHWRTRTRRYALHPLHDGLARSQRRAGRSGRSLGHPNVRIMPASGCVDAVRPANVHRRSTPTLSTLSGRPRLRSHLDPRPGIRHERRDVAGVAATSASADSKGLCTARTSVSAWLVAVLRCCHVTRRTGRVAV